MLRCVVADRSAVIGRLLVVTGIISTALRIGLAALVVALPAAGGLAAYPDPAIVTLLRQQCGTCHCDGAAEGSIALDALLGGQTRAPASGEQASAEQAAWLAVWRNLRCETMPPADEPQPTAQQRELLVQFVERDVLGIDPARPDPGRVVLRRLNRVEYANTVRDLTGLEINLLDTLPADDTGYGFDTIGDVLSMSPLLVEKFLATATVVAEKLVEAAVPVIGHDRSGQPLPLAYPKAIRRVFAAGPRPDNKTERAAHLTTTVRQLAERAFRRPVDQATVDRLVNLAQQTDDAPGGTFEKGVAAVLTAVLSSPRFLFRVEAEAAPDAHASPTAVPLDEFSLASRLSYFLWSSLPDDKLLNLARAGQLRAQFPQQVARMLSDRRSKAFVGSFVGQWLQTWDVEKLPFDVRAIAGKTDRKALEKSFSRSLRRSMRLETEHLFAHLLRNNLPATDLLVGRDTFLNEELAAYYGVPGIKGKKMRLVSLDPASQRGGLLTQGSVLVVTSNPSRTSPVKRGLFILENLLGTPAPPPPPNVPPLEAAAAGGSLGMRELMQLHRREALCASCHARMDPLGLTLEHYNALGQWREDETIDTSGRLITGEEFTDSRALAAVIAGPRRRDFHRCLTEKLLTYALGRGLEYFDAPAVDRIVADLEKDGRLVTAVLGVVGSVPFQMRRPGPIPTAAVPPPAVVKGTP